HGMAEVDARMDVERGQGLVEQEELRVDDEGSGQSDPGRLTAGDGFGATVRTVADPESIEYGLSLSPCLSGGRAAGTQTEAHIVDDAQMREQQRVLREMDDAASVDRRPVPGIEVEDRVRPDAQPAGIGPQRPGEHLEQARLAG